MQDENNEAVDAPLLPVYSEAARKTRLSALRAHMHKRAEYRTDAWWQTLTQIRGRNLELVGVPWLVLVSLALVWTALAERGPGFFARTSKRLAHYGAALSVVQAALAFLVIFRLARAAERFWEARRAAGRMIASCRSLASTATSAMVDADAVRRWIAAFPVATKNYLRGERGDRAEIGDLLSEIEAVALLDQPCQPIYCLDRLRHLVVAWARESSSYVDAHLLASSLRELDELTLEFGAMERINNTPLPFVYVAHLRVFLVVFLACVPLVFERAWRWGTPLATALVAFALLGVEAAAVECERPFNRDPNHFALELFCVTIDANIEQTRTMAASLDRSAEDAAPSEDGCRPRPDTEDAAPVHPDDGAA